MVAQWPWFNPRQKKIAMDSLENRLAALEASQALLRQSIDEIKALVNDPVPPTTPPDP